MQFKFALKFSPVVATNRDTNQVRVKKKRKLSPKLGVGSFSNCRVPTPHAFRLSSHPALLLPLAPGAAALPFLPHPNRLRHRPDPRGAVTDRRASTTDRAPSSGSRDPPAATASPPRWRRSGRKKEATERAQAELRVSSSGENRAGVACRPPSSGSSAPPPKQWLTHEQGCPESPAMKCLSDSSGGGDDPRPPATAATGVDDSPSGEPSKKQRTEERYPSSSVAGECSSSSTQAPPPPVVEQLPQDARVGEPPPPPPGPESGGGEQVVRVPDLGEDLVFEVLMRAEARTLAAAACVSRGWRLLARDERLWEAACVRDWAYTGFSEQMLRSVVLSLGGFRRLHERYIRPVQQRAAGAPPGQQRRQLPVRMGRDQVQVSLSLLSTSFFLKMPNAPPPPPKDKDNKDRDRNGGGQCG